MKNLIWINDLLDRINQMLFLVKKKAEKLNSKIKLF